MHACILARMMWKRWKAKEPKIPNGFPLQSFHKFLTGGLDVLCFTHTNEQATKVAKAWIAKEVIIHVHPEWLFQRGKINYRGPFYETLRRILDVDKELETVTFQKKSSLQ